MNDKSKTKQELISELAEMRQRIAELEVSETERKKAEETLRREKDRAERYLNIAGAMLAIVNADEKIIVMNKKGCEILGYKEKELIGKNWFDLLVPQRIRDEVKDVFHKLMAGDIRPIEHYENPLLTKDGEERLITFHNTVMRGPNDQIVAVLFSAEDITERKKAEEKLRESEQSYRELANSITDVFFAMDRDLRYTYWNKASEELTGIKAKDAIGKSILEIFPDNEETRTAVKVYQEVLKTKQPKTFVNEYRIGGKRYFFEITAYSSKDGLSVFVKDVTERKKMEEALIQERNLLQALIDNIPDAIYFKDDKNRFIRVNKARADLSGTTPENMIGKTDFDFFLQEQARQAFADDSRVMESNRSLVDKVEKITDADGTEHWFSVTKIPRHNERGQVTGTMGISRDITERKQQEKQLAYMTTHDTLTGLANRALFRDHLALALAHAQRNRQKFPIMLLDLDNFKDVNDRLGHSVGDKLLQAAGDRLKGILRKADTVARMGGDEFLLLLPETTKAEDVDVVAQKILAVFQKPFLLDGHEVNTTTSIGIAIYPSDGEDDDTLTKNADIAMYHAKEKGRNNYQYYAAALDTQDIANS